MIGNLSAKIVKKLVDLSVISDTEQELYTYGFFILISHIMYLVIALIFGSLLGIVLESAVFYISFQFIRRYAGGIHASTETKCEITSTLAIMLSIMVIKISYFYSITNAVLTAAALSAIVIFALCPLDTPEKPLSTEEHKHFRKISLIILFIIVLVIAVSYAFKFKITLISSCMSLVLESILLVAGKIKKLINKEDTIEA